jgi:predicted oxidoreductase
METTTKIITLASFVYVDKVDTFKKYLQKRFKISYFEDNKKIITYRVSLVDNTKIDMSSIYPPTIIVHKKGECFYTINALNKLIETLNNLENGNINYLEYKINWDEYQNKIIIIKNEELKIIDINKDFS